MSLYLAWSNLNACVADHLAVLVFKVCIVIKFFSAELPHTSIAILSTKPVNVDLRAESVHILIKSEL